MIVVRYLALITFVSLYFSVANQHYQNVDSRSSDLKSALPEEFYRIVSGYTKQFIAEALFIKTSVFLGGIKAGSPKESYQGALANNFEIMTDLYPEFVDPYYFTQGFLVPISKESASIANGILEKGVEAIPQDRALRMFLGTNYFLYLDEPLKASRTFTKASKELPNAPPMFAHLAALLSAKGGDVAAGIISLETLIALEQNQNQKQVYEMELQIFKATASVQVAINTHINKYGRAPESLKDLIPEFLSKLPDTKNFFDLKYDPPDVKLVRPSKKAPFIGPRFKQ